MKILVLVILLSGFVQAEELTTQCQQNLDMVVRMSAGAESLKKQCLDAVSRDYVEKKQKEVRALEDYATLLTKELKKVAVSVNPVIVNCGVETMRKIELVFKCRQLNNQRDAVQSRIKRLNEWEKNLNVNLAQEPVPLDLINPHPCASSAEFEQLKSIEKTNRALYQSWVECRNK